MRKTFVKKIVRDIVVVFQVQTKCKTIWRKLSCEHYIGSYYNTVVKVEVEVYTSNNTLT